MNIQEEAQAFMTRAGVEVGLKKEKGKASASTFNFGMKHLYSLQVAVKPYPAGHVP